MLPTDQAIADFYRFALLLTGNAARAESLILEVLTDGAQEFAQFRTAEHCHAWLITRIRQRTNSTPPVEPDEAPGFPARFSRLPEPGRSALGLFYLDLFSPGEIADILGLHLEDLGAELQSARAALAAQQTPIA